ncbi:MAG: AAA family ATPase [Clostridiales bacterium]|nr:AAA family ATPase [Clostridiales bacterium]
MEIRELDIKSYGKFSNHHMTFRPGINIIYGGNETGKTTIHSFIRAMLFGLNRARGRATKADEYQLRQPWDAPGAFLGSMRISENGDIYRIDRCFDRSAAPLSLVCETRMVESGHPQEDLEVLLGGISEAAFVNSVFIRQAQCETDEELAQELRRYMINSDNSRDSEIDVAQALQSLRKKKKQLEQQKKKETEALEENIAQKQSRADALRSELELLRQQAGYYQNASGGTGSIGAPEQNPYGQGNAGGSGQQDKDHSPNETAGRSKDRGVPSWIRILLGALFFIAGALTLTQIFFTQENRLRIFLGIFTVLFWGMALGVFLLLRPARGSFEEDKGQESRPQCPPELLKEIQDREEACDKLKGELEILYQAHARGETDISGSDAVPGGIDTEIAALTLAIDRICEISDRIYQAAGGQLNERASAILEEITGGRYNRIVIDDTAEIRIHTPSRVLGLNQLSGGTMQQIYFALRMAAGELLCENITLPVILDETFAMYDDRRLEATLRWLKNSGRQVILFTCQNREREILKRL